MYGISGLLGSNLFSYNSYSLPAYQRLMNRQYSNNRLSNSNYSSTGLSRYGTSSKVSSAYSDVISSADSLSKDASKLSASGKDSTFASKITVDSNGKKVAAYDLNKVYRDVKGFIGDYNKTIDNTLYSGNQSLQSVANNMTNTTRIMSKSLSDVGITMGSDGKLSIDEGVFKNSDMSKVKNLFSGSGSYASTIGSQASRLESQATYQANRALSTGYDYFGTSGSYGRNAANNSFVNYLNYYSMFNGLF